MTNEDQNFGIEEDARQSPRRRRRAQRETACQRKVDGARGLSYYLTRHVQRDRVFITHQGDELNLLKENSYGDGSQATDRSTADSLSIFTGFHIWRHTQRDNHKICRVMIGSRNGVPFISLIDSAARIRRRSMGGYAEIFRRNAQYLACAAGERDAWPMRGRRGLLPRFDGHGHHGRKIIVHVSHWARCN